MSPNRATTAALRAQYRAAVDVAMKALKDSPEQLRDITARADALRAEHQKRVAAGVNPGSFDARHAALQQATTAWHQQHGQAKGDLAHSLTEILLRSLAALDALETRAFADGTAEDY